MTTITHIVDVPMVAFEEHCRAKTCLLFVRKGAPPAGHQIIMSYPTSIGQDKNGKPLYLPNSRGERKRGDLDNEMADAVKHLTAMDYSETQPRRQVAERINSRYSFAVSQTTARARGVLVPRFWWRDSTEAGMETWTRLHPSKPVTLGALADRGILQAFGGHGSPPGHSRKTGDVPYVKVTDLKNWRINENPANFISQGIADGLRRGGPLPRYGDLVTPARASSNIGQFCMVLPWQTHVVFTKEILLLRVADNDEGINPFLLLALLSLKVVQDQYAHLVLMQTNRDDLGDRWREVILPMPATPEERAEISRPVREYFDGVIKAREAYDQLLKTVGSNSLGVRP